MNFRECIAEQYTLYTWFDIMFFRLIGVIEKTNEILSSMVLYFLDIKEHTKKFIALFVKTTYRWFIHGQSQQPEPSTSTGSGTSRPRRGRPSGANRVPLTLEERRARNAQYERERREDFAAAQTELAEAAGCDPNTSTINLMAFVVTKLKKASEDLSIEEYQRINANLEAQIASCFERLGPEYVLSGDEDDVEADDSNTRKRKLSQETSRDEKRMRPGAEQVPVSGSGPMVSTTDLAEAEPSFSGTHSQLPSSFFPSPNSPEIELLTPSQFAHHTPPPLLQLDTALEQEIALRFSQDDLLQIYGALESEDFI
ncbi:hypothetical protein HW555_010679 [Spodoptera exigua]|uniref:Uncharacterized protein n=1 Tax=Spodoptera exigua TaxID=7107 RepID=A0A835GAL3_SPOEX|nr:hypothetical protein HW555_010679 [Spodoptera exigua]